jgi:hypothetical protein
VATGDSLSICTQVKAARQQLSQAHERLGTCQGKGASEAQSESAQAQGAAGDARGAHGPAVHDPSRGPLEARAFQGPPWRGEDSTPQSAQEVEAPLGAEVTARQALREANGLPVQEQGLEKVRTQRAAVAAVIDLWWPGVRQEVHTQMAVTPRWA